MISPPYYSKVIKDNYKLLTLWAQWFQDLYIQVGGNANISVDNLTSDVLYLNTFSIDGVSWPTTIPDGYIVQKTSATIMEAVPASAEDSSIVAGEIETCFFQTAPTGWVMLNDGTIGDASSGATTRANADCEDLFTALWDGSTDSECPVSGGRGASASADFAAHKTIATPLIKDCLLAVSGSGAGLTSRTANSTSGANDILVAEDELPVHQHTADFNNGSSGIGKQVLNRPAVVLYNNFPVNMSNNITDITVNGNSYVQTTMNIEQPSVFVNIIMKL